MNITGIQQYKTPHSPQVVIVKVYPWKQTDPAPKPFLEDTSRRPFLEAHFFKDYVCWKLQKRVHDILATKKKTTLSFKYPKQPGGRGVDESWFTSPLFKFTPSEGLTGGWAPSPVYKEGYVYIYI